MDGRIMPYVIVRNVVSTVSSSVVLFIVFGYLLEELHECDINLELMCECVFDENSIVTV
jgi:hypothetical protein